MTTEVIIVVAVQLLVGVILWNQVRSQSAVLGHYKDLLSSIDPGKMKSQMDLIEKATEMKHKALAAQQVEELAKEAMRTGRMIDADFGKKYNEMMGVHLFHIGKLKGHAREEALSWFPNCAEDMRRHLNDKDAQEAKDQAK